MAKREVLSNYGLVLIHVAASPDSTLREIAESVSISDRAVTAILRDMEEQRLIATQKRGRRSHYRVDFKAVMQTNVGGGLSIRDLTRILSNILRDLEGDSGTAA